METSKESVEHRADDSSVAPDLLIESAVRSGSPARNGHERRPEFARERHHSDPPPDRRSADGGVVAQIDMVESPHTPLPPFGRRRDDIRSVPHSEMRLQRMLDVIVASLVAAVAIVPCILIAIAVKLTSRGPVFFRQERVGRHGDTFRIIKFRTMRNGTADEVAMSAAQRKRYVENSFKLDADDPRITPLGRFLRRTSLDELPQLLNVLRGDMSVVGIRPLIVEEYLERSPIDRELYARFRPGLTGLWQISGRSSVVHNQRIVLDRAYAADWSVRRNVSILVRTPASLVSDEEPDAY